MAPGRARVGRCARLGAALAAAPVAAALVDAGGVIREANASLGVLAGRPLDELEGRALHELLHLTDPNLAGALLDLSGVPIVGSAELVRPGGDTIEVRVHVVAGDDGPVVFLDDAHDSTAVREAMARERAADRRFRLLVDALPDPVVIVDRDVRITYANLMASELMGATSVDLRGRVLDGSVLPASVASAWSRAIGQVLSTGEMRDVELSFPGPTSPRWYWTRLAPERGPDGSVAKVIAMGRDITDRKETERRLEDLARRDPLTGLANRRHLDDVLANALDRSRASGRSVAVVFLDVDGLKRVNDEHGHEVGDALLVAFARRLRSGARSADTVCRLGGDEFVVVCEEVDGATEATGTARRMLDRVTRPYAVAGLVLRMATSIGLVTLDAVEAVGVSPGELLRDADAAMYHAKVHGGSTVAVFDRSVDAPVLPQPV